jgi:N-acetylglucosamine-6-phosphate deacetylase
VRLHENAVLIVEDGKVKKIQSKEEYETESIAKNASPSATTEVGESSLEGIS